MSQPQGHSHDADEDDGEVQYVAALQDLYHDEEDNDDNDPDYEDDGEGDEEDVDELHRIIDDLEEYHGTAILDTVHAVEDR